MLEQLRQDLDGLNNQLFTAFEKRAEIVRTIQASKEEPWSPDREFELFQKYISKNPTSNLKKDFWFSLLIEMQAEEFEYPRWSEGEHLSSGEHTLHESINPLLLRMRDELGYLKLNLIPYYKERIESVWKK